MKADRAPLPTPGDVLRRMREGELTLLPIAAALVVIWIGFGLANPTFWSSENLVNLSLQSVSTGVIALGVVIVLLVGQIDLSVGSVSGVAAAVVAAGAVNGGWPLWVGVLVAIAVGVVVGLVLGIAVTRLGLPSFVLTLAALLVLAGVQVRILEPAGSVNIPFDSWLVKFCQAWFLPTWFAWSVVVVVVVGFAATRWSDRRRRRAADLPYASTATTALHVGTLAAVLCTVVAVLGGARGVGYSVVLFVVLVAVADVLLRRTRWGRAVHAIGGNRRAAVLAGLPVRRTVVSAFVACSALAALGGVLAAGRLAAANQETGGGDIFLTAIAAAVIGGTSLFGGRGRAWSALLGVLVIQSISNGLTLLDLDTATRSIVTGAVLALAITIDTVVRGRRPE
ncbi:simple sugar transport system permease protein/D-xylose transport system permease protein [Sediminihabitans luteus]|uniref:Xylose transport system permease protein XylH n=1 Tax=Sediminihabitans luteus TaxID=1138585 RepID=A0A2M9CF40_9CELL|nr:ABC transporter permease [Sediminihabitans luteus]PJJ70470.1 simple sugar transport system permease protein/D-xylose transport system permease protein [Sediminihabitans luteus]GII97943.1 ABC transporter permease [Sediminihabitans luteus]